MAGTFGVTRGTVRAAVSVPSEAKSAQVVRTATVASSLVQTQ